MAVRGRRDHHYLARAAKFDLQEIRAAVKATRGFNAKVAVLITRSVGTMACAYVFAVIALISLPAAISTGQPIIIVAWVAQTFLQLVLLAIILVGQAAQAVSSDDRANKTFADTETLLDRFDEHTEGGIKLILDRLDTLAVK